MRIWKCVGYLYYPQFNYVCLWGKCSSFSFEIVTLQKNQSKAFFFVFFSGVIKGQFELLFFEKIRDNSRRDENINESDFLKVNDLSPGKTTYQKETRVTIRKKKERKKQKGKERKRQNYEMNKKIR